MFAIIFWALCTGFASGFGALLAHFFPIGDRWLAALLGAAAGIMVGLSLFGLLPEANACSRPSVVVAGFLWGILLMRFIEGVMNRGHSYRGREGGYISMGHLIVIGIALHNFPEGLALGAGFRGGTDLGYVIAFSLMLHDIPEGISMAAPLRKGGFSLPRILLLATLAGLVTPVGAAAGWLLSGISASFLGMAMGIAAGAMVFISFDALLPEAQNLHRHFCNSGVYIGIVLTFLLQFL